MSSDYHDRIDDLFCRALQLPPSERGSFLLRQCPDDPDLRREVESLLEADAEAERRSFLESSPADGIVEPDGLRDPQPGDLPDQTLVGPYRVLKRLGHGGMGDVYLAVREDPYRRYVALKVIRRGADSQDVVARFAIERQILASLEHPGIARLIDGGLTEDGRPYFAMEYVEGQPITRYSDDRRLSVPERLGLFMDVCHAVHYAHQNLVLHRDLKPTNILVTARGHGKLLDFGIAKLLNPQLSHLPAPVTRAESRVLTPEYASPEQIRGEPLTTTSDVYSLGVLLYELLTGRRPHRLQGCTTEQMIRIVSDEVPPNPSVAVMRPIETEDPSPPDGGTGDASSSGGERRSSGADSVAHDRASTPDRLRRQLRGDLDAIVLKALRKEPNQRYGSAELLAQDIERHLAMQPVSARKGNRRYRLGAFLRRYRVEAGAAIAVVIALVGGLGIALWQADEARRERDRAESERIRAEEMAGFTESLFTASDPYALSPERLDTLSVREFLNRGAEQVLTGLDDQPTAKAQMLDVVGRVYHRLGSYEEAHPLLVQALELRREHLERTDPDLATSMQHLADLLTDMGDYAPARALLEDALEIGARAWGENHERLATSSFLLGTVLREQGHMEEAEVRQREALEMLRRINGDRDPVVVEFMTELVGTMERQGEFDEAEELARETIVAARRMYGDGHPRLAVALRELGLILQRKAAYGEAEALFRESYAIILGTLGPEHPRVADLLNRIASVRWWQKDYAAADSMHRRSIELKRRIYGNEHIEVAWGLNNLASVVRDMGNFSEAEDLLREALGVTAAVRGTDHADYFIVLANLGKTKWAQDQCEEAEPIMRRAVDGLRRTLPKDPLRAPLQAQYLGDCLRRMGRYDEAEPLLIESHAAIRSRRGDQDEMTRDAAAMIVALYDEWGHPDRAAPYRTPS